MAPRLWCFVHFDLKMCFAPQRRAIFADRNVQNGSEHEVFCTFWLTNVLRATAACHFSRSQLQKWLREWGVLYILTYKCASRHSGVQFFIPPLSSYLRTRLFYEPTFRTAGTTNDWKNTAIRDVANISRTCILCTTLLLYTALLHDLTAVVHCFSTRLDCCCTLLFYTTFQLSILSEVSALNFLRWCWKDVKRCQCEFSRSDCILTNHLWHLQDDIRPMWHYLAVDVPLTSGLKVTRSKRDILRGCSHNHRIALDYIIYKILESHTCEMLMILRSQVQTVHQR